MRQKVAVSAIGVAAFAVCSSASQAGVLQRVTLEGEITYVGELIGTPMGHMDINPRSSDRWSLTFVFDPGAPDHAVADLVRYRTSVVGGELELDEYPAALAFDDAGTGLQLDRSGPGSVDFAAVMLGELDVSVRIGGVTLEPSLALPDSIDTGSVSHTSFKIQTATHQTLVAGTLDGYTLETIVPAPGAALLPAFAGVGALSRRRRA